MAVVFLALGSNLGDKKLFIEKALRMLEELEIEILLSSKLYETQPVGGPAGQDNYLNGVIKAKTNLTPEALLKTINQIENSLGRTREVKNGPRTIDIDILLYDNLLMSTKKLTIPHPRMKERDFVMVPLREIAPEIADILQQKTQ